MASAGRNLGYAGIALISIVVGSTVISRKLVSPIAVNEANAIVSLRTVWTATAAYSDTYRRGYPPSLAALGPPPGQKPAAEAANLLDAQLASGRKSGYIFRYQPVSSHRDGKFDGFDANADPISPDQTGNRHFHVDETGVIRVGIAASAGRASPAMQ